MAALARSTRLDTFRMPVAAMLDHPVPVNRPIACTARGVRPCRPSETVLDRLPPGPFAKEGGSLLIDANGCRVG